jgi:hypothetical protein
VKCVQQIHTYLDDCYKAAENDQQRYDIEKTRGMAVGYAVHYENDGYETLGVEEAFDLPIIDPETEEPSGRTYNGIEDCLLRRREDGKLIICDHKTATKVDDNYWAELKTNPQLSRYWLSRIQRGFQPDGFLWDVILKPGISPKDLTKKAVKEITEEYTYCGLPWRHGYNGEEKETPKMYGQRVLADYLTDPKRFFIRRTLYRQGEDLLEFLKELCAVTAEMKSVEGDIARCPRNLYACKSFNRMCDYHPICCGDDAGKGRYQPRKKADEDEPKFIEGSISNSQVSTFQRCKREWHYRYVEKIEPMRPEYSDSLYIGSMMHKCLEFYLDEKRGDETICL